MIKIASRVIGFVAIIAPLAEMAAADSRETPQHLYCKNSPASSTKAEIDKVSRIETYPTDPTQNDQVDATRTELINVGFTIEQVAEPNDPTDARAGIPPDGTVEIKYFDKSNTDNVCKILVAMFAAGSTDYKITMKIFNPAEMPTPDPKLIEIWWPRT
jgi:hypothetical protein